MDFFSVISSYALCTTDTVSAVDPALRLTILGLLSPLNYLKFALNFASNNVKYHPW